MDREKKKYIALMILGLLLVWLVNDFVLVKEEVFQAIEQYSFEGKPFVVVKEKVKQEIKRLQSAGNMAAVTAGSLDAADQVVAIVHMLECNYYLLLNRQKRLTRYYDFIKLVLYPPQRGDLRERTDYIREMKRHLKRKKNLKLHFREYIISSPVITGTPGSETAEVLVARIMTPGDRTPAPRDPADSTPVTQSPAAETGAKKNSEDRKEYARYYFRRHTDRRFYLYYKDSFLPTRLRFLETEKNEIKQGPGSPGEKK